MYIFMPHLKTSCSNFLRQSKVSVVGRHCVCVCFSNKTKKNTIRPEIVRLVGIDVCSLEGVHYSKVDTGMASHSIKHPQKYLTKQLQSPNGACIVGGLPLCHSVANARALPAFITQRLLPPLLSKKY